jgi:Uma2 family endonuclease
MAATTHLMTVAEFASLPEDHDGIYRELHHGEIVTLTRPKFKHSRIQHNIRDLVQPHAAPGAYVDLEMAFRPLPEHECWGADVAYLSAERSSGVDPEDYVSGAPDLVVEVLSPSNTVSEMLDRERICLANGAKEFWVVDPSRCRIKVTTCDGHSNFYEAGQRVPLLLAPDAWLNVDDVFRY